ncbi:hypothetical protein MLD38_017088 [Melastoma candidum]|uniref:Uncharacterized protein n=1 Tax=Melastoma candidum TaxID=119954 RepID=A0ACB9QSL9_9MYRT|nr:hypothetical protein MLD38_017088 [Melastoma candidum]
MAHAGELPCDGDGNCMVCRKKPSTEETISCATCATPWHVACLPPRSRPKTMADAEHWQCPDCSNTDGGMVRAVAVAGGDLVAAIREIERDKGLTEKEKAMKRQDLLGGRAGKGASAAEAHNGTKEKEKGDGVIEILDRTINCSFCMHLPERPVTTPCGHNFCLKCFQKWVGQGKRTCANCRKEIPPKMASQPRINSQLVMAIRLAKMARSNNPTTVGKTYHFVHNQNRPDKAFTTERAKKPGKANACSGKIFVTVPPDHFGPIPAENDPERNQGVLVGESWEDRMECRQWGAHLPHVAGIAGQSNYGSQSVALSGGYQDDEDHGEWFLYTGSGGRDLTGNKRTNKEQSSDQRFEKLNEALRVSCKKGYPVRVVRSHKEKRSSYAPETGVRYDGIYRIEKCWRKTGIQGFLVCRYLFVRCDNDPAPWTSDEHGDRPRPLPVIKELKKAHDLTERKGTPSWDYDAERGCWTWVKPPPSSKKTVWDDATGKTVSRPKRSVHISLKQKLLREFNCGICRNVLTIPLTTPCGHNFCKTCLEGEFAGQSFMRQRGEGRRTLRAQRNVMKCPSCPCDISEFLQNPQVNRELMGVIESLQCKIEEEEAQESGEEVDADNEIPENITEDESSETKADESEDPVPKTPETEKAKKGATDDESEPLSKRKKCTDAENATGIMTRSKRAKMAGV